MNDKCIHENWSFLNSIVKAKHNGSKAIESCVHCVCYHIKYVSIVKSPLFAVTCWSSGAPSGRTVNLFAAIALLSAFCIGFCISIGLFTVMIQLFLTFVCNDSHKKIVKAFVCNM